MTSTDWPAWSLAEDGGALAGYIVPGVVRLLIPVDENAPGSALGQLRAVWQLMRAREIGYAHALDTIDPTVQPIRTPGEVLTCPRSATCLDIALVLAGACEIAGLPVAVLVVDPTTPGAASHALLAVNLRDRFDAPGPAWTAPPTGFLDSVRDQLSDPTRPVVVLDPVGVTHTLAASPIRGTDTSIEDAATAGYRYLTGDGWAWRLGVPAAADRPSFVPATLPTVMPLREIYRRPDTAESALRLCDRSIGSPHSRPATS